MKLYKQLYKTYEREQMKLSALRNKLNEPRQRKIRLKNALESTELSDSQIVDIAGYGSSLILHWGFILIFHKLKITEAPNRFWIHGHLFSRVCCILIFSIATIIRIISNNFTIDAFGDNISYLVFVRLGLLLFLIPISMSSYLP